VPTDEEIEIANQALEVLGRTGWSRTAPPRETIKPAPTW